MDERKRNNSGFFIIIIMLLVIIIALGCVIGYLLLGGNEKNEVKDNNTVEVEKEEGETDVVETTAYTPKCLTEFMDSNYTTDVDVSKYNNIFDYIENQENVTMSIKYSYPEPEPPKAGQVKLSDSEVKQILSEVKQSNITIDISELGAPGYKDLVINYTRNGVAKYIEFWNSLTIQNSNDGNIYKIIDNTYNGNAMEYCGYMVKSKLSPTLDTIDPLNR